MFTPCIILIIWFIKIRMDLITPFRKVPHKGPLRTESNCFLIMEKEIKLGGIVNRLPSFCLRIGSLAMCRSFRIGSCLLLADSSQKSVRFIKGTERQLGDQEAVSILFSPFCPFEVRGSPVSNTEVKKITRYQWA